MKNLKKLITETVNLSKMDWAIKEDMADMFKADWQDYVNVNDLIVSGKTHSAMKKLQYMDTLPRDNAIIAIAKDLGNNWVLENLNYHVA